MFPLEKVMKMTASLSECVFYKKALIRSIKDDLVENLDAPYEYFINKTVNYVFHFRVTTKKIIHKSNLHEQRQTNLK